MITPHHVSAESHPGRRFPSYSPESDVTPHWSAPTRVAFRLCFVYFGLYVITTQMLSGLLPVPGVDIPVLGVLPPTRDFVLWIGQHVLRISRSIAPHPTGSGDTAFDWVQAFTLLLIASFATAVWSVVARQRQHHARLFAWFRLFLRFALGTTFLTYGLSKVIPEQMPILALSRLVEPFGNFSPMGVLWYSVGASPAYEIFIGSAEVAAALLLFLPRTATLGAVLGLMDAIGIFTMNMTYDVPVKLFSFHLILMSLFLLAPNVPRLLDLFLFERTTGLRGEPSVGASARARRTGVIAQVAFALYVVVMGVYQGVQGWNQYGGGAPRSALFGIWDVQQMSIDGLLHPPLLSDTTRWRRVIFQSPGGATFQRMSDAFDRYLAGIDTTAKTLTLTPPDPVKTKSVLSYQRPAKDRLIVDGSLNGHTIHMELAFRDPNSFLVRSRGFNWVQEFPFNR